MIKLTSERSSSNRYYLHRDGKGLGGYGKPEHHYLNQFVIVRGIDCGNGFQGYMSVDYALQESFLSESAKSIVRQHITEYENHR